MCVLVTLSQNKVTGEKNLLFSRATARVAPTNVDEALSQNKVTVIIVFFYYSFVLSQRNQKTFKGKPLEKPRSIMPES